MPASCGACSRPGAPRRPGDRLAGAGDGPRAGWYWYQFILALRYQKAGLIDRDPRPLQSGRRDRPESPWARHNRARALPDTGGLGPGARRPAAGPGDDTRLRSHARVPEPRGCPPGDGRLGAAAPITSEYASGARSEWSGPAPEPGKARFRRRGDGSGPRRIRCPGGRGPVRRPWARRGRAMLALRLGRPPAPKPTSTDCSGDPATGGGISRDPGLLARILALRSIARLSPTSAGRGRTPTPRWPSDSKASPGHDRLWNRALLASGREIELDTKIRKRSRACPAGTSPWWPTSTMRQRRLREAADGTGPVAAVPSGPGPRS